MIDAMYISNTGLLAGQQQIDTISNNLANINTPGFKRATVNSSDLIYNRNIGLGTSVGDVSKVMTQGELTTTNNPSDVAIDGEGFFEVMLQNGEHAYTRTGQLDVDNDGYLMTGKNRLSADIQVPSDAKSLTISEQGEVFITLPDQETPIKIGELKLANFMSKTKLQPLGDNLYASTLASGEAYYSAPGENDVGLIKQNKLESSNVDMSDELSQLMLAQRAYEVNARALQVSDQFMKIINDIAGQS